MKKMERSTKQSYCVGLQTRRAGYVTVGQEISLEDVLFTRENRTEQLHECKINRMYSFLMRKEDSMTKQPWRIMPKTTLGKWSVGLIVAMPILFIIGTSFTNSLYKSVPAGGTILADITARPALALTMLAGMVAGISAFITGLLAIIRQKEHALLVYVSSSIGALLVLFLAGEILFPH